MPHKYTDANTRIAPPCKRCGTKLRTLKENRCIECTRAARHRYEERMQSGQIRISENWKQLESMARYD